MSHLMSLLGVKRTWAGALQLSAHDPKRTSCRVRLALPEYAQELLPSHCQSLGATMRRRQFIRLLGGAAVLPITARAQQSALPLIGYLSGRSPEDTVGELEAFHKGLGE